VQRQLYALIAERKALPIVFELAANICCVVLLIAVIFPAAHGIARYIDHLIQDVLVHIRSPELVDCRRFEV